MIAIDDFQVAVISKLKADTPVVNYLTARSAGAEIREASWQGTEFSYPAIRVQIGTEVPQGNGVCYLSNSDLPFTVFTFSEKDSSVEANELAWLVNAALMGKKLSGSGFGSLSIMSDGLTGAVRTEARVWRATGLYRTFVYETQ